MSTTGVKYLITGARGLLGSAFERKLSGDCVGVKHLDLTWADNCEKVLSANRPAVVIHCAAKIGGIAEQQADPSMPVTLNLVLTAKLFEACAKADPQPKVLFVSSSTVYPACDWPVDESVLPDPAPCYQGVGGVKAYLESLARFYFDKFNLDVRIIRPTAIYGPGDRSSHVIPDLLRRAMVKEDPLVVWGDPGTVRDFVYVDDVVEAGLAALERGQPRRPYNVGSGAPITIAGLANAVIVAVRGLDWVVGREESSAPLLAFDATKPQAVSVRQVNVNRSKVELGWMAKTSLSEGLRQTVAWMRHQGRTEA